MARTGGTYLWKSLLPHTRTLDADVFEWIGVGIESNHSSRASIKRIINFPKFSEHPLNVNLRLFDVYGGARETKTAELVDLLHP